MRGRLLRALPLLIAAGLLGAVAESGAALLLGAVAVLLGILLSRRLVLSAFAEVVACLLSVGLAIPLSGALVPAGDDGLLPGFWAAVALSGLLCAVLRLILRAPAGGSGWTYVLCLVPIAACGEVRVGPLYPVAVTAYLLSALLALRAEDPARTPWALLPRRSGPSGPGS